MTIPQEEQNQSALVYLYIIGLWWD